MKRTVIAGIVIFSCFTAVQGSDKLDLARELQKLSSNPDEKKELLNDLSDQKNIAEQLHDLFFADTATMLKWLGDDSFAIRELATEMLAQQGSRVSEQVKEYMKSTNDPEVKVRCRSILKNAGKKTHQLPNLMIPAFQVIFTLPENHAGDIDFLKCYFRNFTMLDSKAQSLLLPALKKSRNYQDKIADDIISAYKNDARPEAKEEWEKGLKSISEEFYLSIAKRAEIEKEIDKVFYNTDENSIYAPGKIIRQLSKIPDFDLIKTSFIKGCLNSDKPLMVLIGIRMMRYNPKLYVDDMVKAVCSPVGEEIDFSKVSMRLRMFNNRKELFHKYIGLFIESKIDELLDLGLSLIDNPDAYKKQLIQRMLEDANLQCVKFLKYHYPEDVPEFQQILLSKIKRITVWGPSAELFPKALRILGYNGHDLDDYFKSHHFSVAVGVDMHVKPEIIAKTALPRAVSACLNHELEYLLDNVAPKNREVVILGIEKHLQKFSSFQFVYPLLKRAPELTDAVLAQLDRVNSEDSYHIMAQMMDQFFSVAELLKKDPVMEQEFIMSSRSGGYFSKLFSNMVLLVCKKDNDHYADNIIKLVRSGGYTYYISELFNVFIKVAAPHKIKEFLAFILEASPESIGSNTAELFTPELKSSIPLFVNYLKNQNDSLYENMYIVMAALRIDRNNQDILSYIKKSYDIKQEKIIKTYPLLDLLSSLNIEVEIPEKQYSDWKSLGWDQKAFLFSVINNSNRNIPLISKILTEYFAKNNIRTYLYISYLQKSKRIRDALLPIFLKLLLTKQNILNGSNILKSFPEYVKNYIPELEKLYRSLDDPEEIENMGYVIASLRENGSAFVPAVEEKYKNESDNRRKLCYHFIMASIHPDKTIRKENAVELVKLMKIFNDNNYSIVNEFIESSGYIALEFPDIINPFLVKCAEDANRLRQNIAIIALTVEQPYSQAAISLIRNVLEKRIAGIYKYTRYPLIVYSLEELKVIPESLHPLIKELAKDDSDQDIKKVAAKLK